jgi:hypothetical protein
MAMDLDNLDRIVNEYLSNQLHINRAASGHKLLCTRDKATMKEVDMAFKAFVPFIHPDKQHFTNWLSNKYPNLNEEETQSCKAILLQFYRIWVQTRDDLKALDKGLVTQVMWTKPSAFGVFTLSLKHAHVLHCTLGNYVVVFDVSGLHRPSQQVEG